MYCMYVPVDENDRDMLLPDQRIWSVAECVKVFMKRYRYLPSTSYTLSYLIMTAWFLKVAKISDANCFLVSTFDHQILWRYELTVLYPFIFYFLIVCQF